MSHAHLAAAAAAGMPPMPGGQLMGFPPGLPPPSVSGAGPHPPPPGHPHPGLPLPHSLNIKSEPRDEHPGNKHGSEDLRNVRVRLLIHFLQSYLRICKFHDTFLTTPCIT